MCASTFRIIADKLYFCGSGCRGRRAGSEGGVGTRGKGATERLARVRKRKRYEGIGGDFLCHG